ncbi:MAG: hypothetical protein ACLTBV_24675 [Enterocloster bolteae]
MLPSAMAKAVLYWGLFIYTVTIPFMVWRLITREVKPGMLHTQAIVLAPCSLCLVSYLNIVKEPVRAVVMILYVCVILSLLFILVKLPRFSPCRLLRDLRVSPSPWPSVWWPPPKLAPIWRELETRYLPMG